MPTMLFRIFNYADHLLVALRIAAVLAKFAITDVIADRADGEFVFNVENGARKLLGIICDFGFALHETRYAAPTCPIPGRRLNSEMRACKEVQL